MKLVTKLSILAMTTANMMFGNLIYVGEVSGSGSGLGAVNTLFTVSSPASTSTESGCLAFNGTTAVTSPCPTGFVGGDTQGINNTFTMAHLYLNNFDSIQLIFNASEPAGDGIIILDLALSLYGGDGMELAVFTLEDVPLEFLSTNTGVGNIGFGFELDATQAAIANSFIGTDGLRIGAAINASNATGGLESVSVRSVRGGGLPPTQVVMPEPSTYALAGFSLIGLAMWNRKKRS